MIKPLKIIPFLIIFLLLLPTLSPATQYRVIRIIDGDTIVVNYQGKPEKVRLLCVNTPESVHPDEKQNIPSGYWKIIIYKEDGKDLSALQIVAFIFSQDILRKSSILDYLVTIDEVKKRSRLDVLWELPDNIEGKVEKALNAKWASKHFH